MIKKSIQIILSIYLLYCVYIVYKPAVYWVEFYIIGKRKSMNNVPIMTLDEVNEIVKIINNVSIIIQVVIVLGITCMIVNRKSSARDCKEVFKIEVFFGENTYYFIGIQEKKTYTVYQRDELTHTRMNRF